MTTLELLPNRPLQVGDLTGVEALPNAARAHLDPFLVLHHATSAIAAGTDPLRAGVGPHPHTGFAPVSLIYQGGVHHRDSAGNSSIVRAGGTQWMAAGRGIQHSERPPADLARDGGVMELIQLWINSPLRHKVDPPAYFAIEAKDMAQVPAPEGVELHLVGGRFEGVVGPITPQSELVVLRASLKAGAKWSARFERSWRVVIYPLDEGLSVNGDRVPGQHILTGQSDGEPIHLSAEASVRVLVLAGQPLNEPIISYGPFVAGSDMQLRDAFRDYQAGKFGEVVEA
jgi:redox-sensitive bicupin YhaK (pirin superfamily)